MLGNGDYTDTDRIKPSVKIFMKENFEIISFLSKKGVSNDTTVCARKLCGV